MWSGSRCFWPSLESSCSSEFTARRRLCGSNGDWLRERPHIQLAHRRFSNSNVWCVGRSSSVWSGERSSSQPTVSGQSSSTTGVQSVGWSPTQRSAHPRSTSNCWTSEQPSIVSISASINTRIVKWNQSTTIILFYTILQGFPKQTFDEKCIIIYE